MFNATLFAQMLNFIKNEKMDIVSEIAEKTDVTEEDIKLALKGKLNDITPLLKLSVNYLKMPLETFVTDNNQTPPYLYQNAVLNTFAVISCFLTMEEFKHLSKTINRLASITDLFDMIQTKDFDSILYRFTEDNKLKLRNLAHPLIFSPDSGLPIELKIRKNAADETEYVIIFGDKIITINAHNQSVEMKEAL